MATWADLAGYIRTSYRVADEDEAGTLIKMIFELGGGRSQLVFVMREELFNVEYARISSPFGDAPEVDVSDAARRAGRFALGGVVMIDDRIFLSHSVPLADLDINEFTGPLNAIMKIADALELTLSDSDRF